MGSLIPPGPVDPWLFFYNLQDCCVWLSLCSFVILLTGIQSFVYFLSFRTSTQRGEVTFNLENLVPKWVYVVIADSWSWISSYKLVAVSLRCQQFLYFRLLEHSHLESREPFCMSHTVVLAPVEYVVLTLFIYEKKILRRIISLSSCPIEKLCENTVKRQNYFGVKLEPDNMYAVRGLTVCGWGACGFSVTWLVGAFFSFSVTSSWASLFWMNQWEWYFFTQRFIDKITNSKAG